MRGKVHFPVLFALRLRITPAYAGKRFGYYTISLRHWDHPRLCGEKAKMLHPVGHFGGSPPPMRGKDANEATTPDAKGITPAYAGKREFSRLPMIVR